MEDIAPILGTGLVLTILLSFLRERYPALAVELTAAFLFALVLLLLAPLGRVVQVFVDLGRRAQVQGIYLDVALKAVAVAYLTAFGAQLSRDAGEETVAGAVELGGKIVILVLALPVFVAILEALLSLLP